MKKLFILSIFGFILLSGIYSQSVTLFDYSDDFIEIQEKYKQRVYEIFERYNYYDAGMEYRYFPVLDDEDKQLAGDYKFSIILSEGSELIDINFLFLCNNEAREAIVFGFFKENFGDFIPCERHNINISLMNFVLPKLADPKWFIMPDKE